MENKEERKGVCTWARRLRKPFFDFNALLATHFSLCRRLTGRRGTRRYVPISVTALTALDICLFEVKKISRRFTCFAARVLA